MSIQAELRAAVQESMSTTTPTLAQTSKVQGILWRLSRQYYENSMKRINAAREPRCPHCGEKL